MNQPYVLLLDDDADLRHAVSQGLELEGHEVSVFEDPLAALSTISRDDYAVIVSDIMMPTRCFQKIQSFWLRWSLCIILLCPWHLGKKIPP
jgi:DNA-binding NtrC family response regulator